jgi:hypothetical protein
MNFSPQIPRALALGWGWDAPLALGKGAVVECAVNGLRVCAPSTTRSGGFAEEGAKIYLDVFDVFHPLREVLGAHSRGPFDAVSGEALDFWRIRRFSLGRPFRAQMNFSRQLPRGLAVGWGWHARLARGKEGGGMSG